MAEAPSPSGVAPSQDRLEVDEPVLLHPPHRADGKDQQRDSRGAQDE
jgi:hypothetical protein